MMATGFLFGVVRIFLVGCGVDFPALNMLEAIQLLTFKKVNSMVCELYLNKKISVSLSGFPYS